MRGRKEVRGKGGEEGRRQSHTLIIPSILSPLLRPRTSLLGQGKTRSVGKRHGGLM